MGLCNFGLEKGLRFLDECHTFAVERYSRLSETQFEDTIKTPFGFDAGRWQLAEGMIDHETHHRGQLHTYLRLLDVEGKTLAPIFEHVCFLSVGLELDTPAAGVSASTWQTQTGGNS